MDTVYIETTVVGSIAGYIHPNLLIAARQAASRVWLSDARTKFRLFVSQLMVEECLVGDPETASERVTAKEKGRRVVVDEIKSGRDEAKSDGR